MVTGLVNLNGKCGYRVWHGSRDERVRYGAICEELSELIAGSVPKLVANVKRRQWRTYLFFCARGDKSQRVTLTKILTHKKITFIC